MPYVEGSRHRAAFIPERTRLGGASGARLVGARHPARSTGAARIRRTRAPSAVVIDATWSVL
jgi:hypothetical protein